MSVKLVQDIEEMHAKFDVYTAVDKMKPEQLGKLLAFRLGMLHEEFTETMEAADNNDAPEVVDGLIDLIVISIGTLDLFGVDTVEAWDEVLKANMSKQVGVKPERPNPLGLPDLIKPEGWVGPDHKYNVGVLDLALDNI